LLITNEIPHAFACGISLSFFCKFFFVPFVVKLFLVAALLRQDIVIVEK